MADRMQPRENSSFVNQPQDADARARQDFSVNQASDYNHQPPFVAPAESFGPFGPLPNYPTGPTFQEEPSVPTPFAPSNAPISTPGNMYAPAFPGASAYPTTPMPGQPYAPGAPGALPYAPYGMYPPLPTPVSTKKPLLFPLTRHASALLQFFGMLLYSLVVALCIMGCVLTMLQIALINTNLYVSSDGSANGLSILLTFVLVLVLLPACSLFSGVFFGSWRGLIVSLLALGGGLVMAHLSDPRFGNPDAPASLYLLLAAPPVTTLIVGFVYDRRKYAAWWKSLLTMFLGTAILCAWFFAFIYVMDANAGIFNTLAANAHMSPQNYLATMGISFGCLSLLIIPLLGVIFAGGEGILHAILARVRRAGK